MTGKLHQPFGLGYNSFELQVAMKVSLMGILTVAGFLLGVIAIVPMLAWWYYSPKAGFRVGGEDRDSPIVVPPAGRVPLALFTRSKRPLEFEDLRISYDPDAVDLSKTKGATTLLTTDNEYPVALAFPSKRKLVFRHLQGNYFDYIVKRPTFRVKLTTTVRARQEDLPFWAQIFGSNSTAAEKVVEFTVSKNAAWTLPTNGLPVAPKETLELEGVQSQEAVFGATKKGTATVRTRKLLEDNPLQSPSTKVK